MKSSFKTGLSFGLTSGVITTLGLMVGLQAGTHSRAVVLGGIVTIAVADALSDAMGVHISEESKNSGPVRHVWESTVATFVSKLCIALTFALGQNFERALCLFPRFRTLSHGVSWFSR